MMPNLSASAGGGGPSSSSSNAGVGTPISNPFNFDGSGWIVNFGNGNSASATGNKEANQTAQATPSGLGGILSGANMNLVILGAVVILLLRKK